MLRATLCGLVTAVALIPTLTVQVPLGSANHLGNEEWNLDKLPSPNATDHLIFDTVHSLLQHWPNTRMRNGHNIVPGKIPKGTLLYHGTASNELPQGPEWVSTDPEHSYFFCLESDSPPNFCWHLTFETTRPLKIIYFDGTSAAKLPYGSLDAQDLIAWGGIGVHNVSDDRQRIQDLCKWGKNFGVDGFVRMEMDFEVMLCNFTSSVSVVSAANLVKLDVSFFEVMNAGSRHNHFPGETRVQLDLTGLVSFYDTQLVPSLIDIRAGQERWDHRVQKISSEDLLVVRSRLEEVLTRPQGLSSGIDWRALIHAIFDRYAGRLELTHHLLKSPVTDPGDSLHLTDKIQTQLRIMLAPYLLFSITLTDRSDQGGLNWSIPAYKLCVTTYAYRAGSELGSMADSEKLLLQAVRGTTREICRVLTRMWATGVSAGIDTSLNTKDSPSIAELTHLWNTWAEDLDHLMAWLDWSVWVKCDPSCGSEEMCYLPTWPIGFPPMDDPPLDPDTSRSGGQTNFDFRTMATEGFARVLGHTVKPGRDEWVRPQPRCIRRVDPYDF